MFILILLLACLKVAHFSNFISSRAVPWMSAQNECTLVVPELMRPGNVNYDISISNGTFNNALAWVGRYISYSKWIEFEGCFNAIDDVVVSAFDISEYNGNRIWRCHNLCQGNYFGLAESECKCFTKSTRYKDISSLCKTNFREEQNGGLYGTSGCICKYTKSNVTFGELNDGNCLAISYFLPRPTSKNFQCNSVNRMLGISGNGSGSFKLFPGNGSWIDSVNQCQSNTFILPKQIDFNTIQPIRNETYWLNVFRIQIYEDNTELPVNTPKLCLALRISGNTGSGTEIRNCSEELPVVCTDEQVQVSDNGGDFTQIILISIVASMCVVVCSLSIIIGVIWHKKYRNHKLVLHSEDVSVYGENHEYHEIELNTIGSGSDGVYNRLHDAPNNEHVGINNVYDHVQNSDYDQMPKYDKAGNEHDSVFTDYDHAIICNN